MLSALRSVPRRALGLLPFYSLQALSRIRFALRFINLVAPPTFFISSSLSLLLPFYCSLFIYQLSFRVNIIVGRANTP